jgi:transcriptional regulator with XRE-family HTH domain
MVRKVERFYSEVGVRIRQLRTKLGLTQEQLGRSLTPQTSRVSIANVESGNQRILSHTLVQLAAALKVSPAELLPSKDATTPGAIDQAIADELLCKAGLSKTIAKKLLENPHALKEWKEKKQ